MSASGIKAELIAIGDELLNGTIVNSNVAYISRSLSNLGIATERQTTLADDLDQIAEYLQSASARNKLVIITGGLGPTEDDLTAQAAARAFELELVLDEFTLETIKAFFKLLDRPFYESNEKQAYLPEGAEIFENTAGTAPAFKLQSQGSSLYFLPGVPREVKNFMETAILPDIKKTFQLNAVPLSHDFHIFGLGESQLSDLLKDIEKDNPIEFHYRVEYPVIHLTLKMNADASEELFSATCKKIRERAGSRIYSENAKNLFEVTLDLLKAKGKTLSTAESCTGGEIASLITDISGASAVFYGSVVSYTNEAKMELLGVNQETLDEFGAVSEQTVKEMAEGAKKKFNTDFALATSGIAGPGGATPGKPVGTVALALATPEGTITTMKHFVATRKMFKRITAHTAINMLKKHLIK